MNPLVNIVILNWNGAIDTIECLESLRKLQRANYRITICDNASTDNSLSIIARWAEQQQLTCRLVKPGDEPKASCADITLVDNGANLGFAAGNNTGIQYALAQTDVDYVWLLNNDTVVESDTLENLVRRALSDTNMGICGSLIKFYDDRSIIQAVGGCRFNSFTGIASQTLGRYLPDSVTLDRDQYEQAMDYVCGASMLVSRAFLEEIGLMEEGYFLYYEEMDWAIRARGKFTQGIALDSVVYHKEGSSIGSASLSSSASPSAEFYMARSKLRFMARHFARRLPLSILGSLGQSLNRFRRGHWLSGLAIAKATLGLPMGNTVA